MAGHRRTVRRLDAVGGQLAIRLGGSSTLRTAEEPDAGMAPAAVVFGPLARTAHLAIDAGFRSVAAGLTAAGWQALLGPDASWLTDRTVALSRLWGGPAVRKLVGLLADAAPGCELDLFERLLLVRLDQARAVDPRTAAIDRWIGRGGRPAELATMLDVSPRHIERLTQQTHGLTPKVLAMRQRALVAATRIVAQPSIRHDFGYSDQSHVIRDFRRFLGTAPGALMRQVSVTQHVLSDPWHVGIDGDRAFDRRELSHAV